jgi:hypothetical protein
MFKTILKNPINNLDVALSVVFYAKIISLFVPIEFNYTEFRENSKIIHNAILIILFFLWVIIELTKPNSGIKWWEALMILIPFSCMILFLCFFILLMPCITEEGITLYKEKSSNGKIVERMLNCGATTDYSYSIYYIKPITPAFNFIWKIDTTNINKNDYVKVRPQNSNE